MITKQDLQTALDSMILTASGWRGIFAVDKDKESKTEEISEAHKIICGAAAFVFANNLGAGTNRPQILLASDTRPTGKAIIDVMMPVLISAGCDICYAGVCAAPEIMAWVRSVKAASMEFLLSNDADISVGFIYISASHNPVGYNGIKFGLSDGGILQPDEMTKLISDFRAFLEKDECSSIINDLIARDNSMQIQAVNAALEVSKTEALKSYYEFAAGTALSNRDFISPDDPEFIHSVSSVVNQNLGIVCDFNGSARAASIDKEVFSSLGLKFESINSEPGKIAHSIVPEGEALEPCRVFLEQKHAQDSSFLIGYVPDCDGDRGNLVIWDDQACEGKGGARVLEAQEVFALACVSEFAFQVWQGAAPQENSGKKAVVVNDPTSIRIDAIAQAFGVEVFRAEVGEANIVGLARSLRRKGYNVRIMGEGSNGGNITHPSSVRDPLHTVLALVKLLAIRSEGSNGQEDDSSSDNGLFEIWCKASGQTDKYRGDFTLSDIIASLPQFETTGVYDEGASLQIKTKDHKLLKDRYQKIFETEWEKRKDEFKKKFGFIRREAIAYNGQEEKRGLKQFGEAGRGGLKILFYNEHEKPSGFIWMRGSATEPVFRLMADVDLTNAPAPEESSAGLLLNWQRSMIIEADMPSAN